MIGELWRESSGVSSFFFRVLFSLLGINLATIVALLYIAYTFSTEALSRHAETSIVQQVDILSVQFNEQYKNALNRVARSLTDASLLDDYLLVSEAERLVLARRLERLFMQMQNDYQDFCTISFVDSNGYIVVEVEENQRQSPRMLAGQKKNQTEWFYAGELFDLLRDTPLLLATGDNKWSMPSRTLRASRLFIGDDDVPKLVAGLGKLDIDTGLFGGAILIQLRLDRWLDELRSILFFGANPVWVVDMEGNTILAPEDAKATYDPRPHLPVETDNGTHLLKAEGGLIVYRDLEIEEGAALLRIAVSLPNELLLSGISKAVDFFTVVIDAYLLVIVISVIMLAIFSFFIARFLAKPVLKLAALQKQLEQQQVSLSESEHRLQEAQSLAGLGNWELNPDTDEAFWSDEQYRLLGYKPGEVKACFSRFMEAIHPDDRPAMSSELRRLGQSGEKDTVSFEHRILLPGGGERMVAENGHAVFDQAGRLPLDTDPKLAWAVANLRQAPVEVNRADRDSLLRVPGIGPKGADAILRARRLGTLREVRDLQQIGVQTKRLRPFVLLDGRRPTYQLPLFEE